MKTEATERDLITEVEELLANAPRNPLFVIPHPEYKAALSRINTNANADWSEFGHVATVSPAWADLFARSPELLHRLVEEVKRLRKQQKAYAEMVDDYYGSR